MTDDTENKWKKLNFFKFQIEYSETSKKWTFSYRSYRLWLCGLWFHPVETTYCPSSISFNLDQKKETKRWNLEIEENSEKSAKDIGNSIIREDLKEYLFSTYFFFFFFLMSCLKEWNNNVVFSAARNQELNGLLSTKKWTKNNR